MTKPLIAILLLRAPPKLSADAIAAALGARDPNSRDKIEVTAAGGSFLVTLGPEVLTVMVMDAPVPPGTLDKACDGNLVWPEARTALAPHRQHIIVGSLHKRTEKAARISEAARLSAVCATLADLTDCLGVYWPASETVVPPQHFLTEAAQLKGGGRAPDFWTRLYLFRGPSKGAETPVGCVTLGLNELVGREIEFEPAVLPPAVVAQRVLGAAHLLLFGTKEIKDGDSIGVSASERIRVRYAGKGTTTPKPVVGLRYEFNAQ